MSIRESRWFRTWIKRGVATAAAAFAACAIANPATAGCRPLSYRGADYTVCVFDPGAERLALFNADQAGRPFGSFSALAIDQSSKGRSLVFAMNAGMYDPAQDPVGLFIENGVEKKPLNRRGGPGNFHLKPNGVFFVAGGRANVLETESFARSNRKPDFATQSGPMLVIEGVIHPSFSPTGTSLKRRNGVGVGADGLVRFAISENPVNFWDFAALFRDELRAKNALFLDGTVSSLYDPASGRNDAAFPLGPIIGVLK